MRIKSAAGRAMRAFESRMIGHRIALAAAVLIAPALASAQESELRYYNRAGYNAPGGSLPVGARGYFSQEKPYVAPADHESLAELTVQGSNPGDRVEVGWRVYANHPNPTLFAYYWSNNEHPASYNVGFVPEKGAAVHLDDELAPATAAWFAIAYDKDRDVWVVGYGGASIGYFPGDLWKRGEPPQNQFTEVAVAQWFGEVAPGATIDPAGVASATWMGNGLLGSAPGSASISYMQVAAADGTWATVSPQFDQLVCFTRDNCVDQNDYVVGKGPGGVGFTYGGPGVASDSGPTDSGDSESPPADPDGAPMAGDGSVADGSSDDIDSGEGGVDADDGATEIADGSVDADESDATLDQGDGGAPDAEDATLPPGFPDLPDGGQGVALGDSHLRTFDGVRYDCEPWGEETLCASLSGDLVVQVRTHQLLEENVAVITAVGVQVGTDQLYFGLDGTTTWQHTPVTYDAGMTPLSPDGGTVWALPNNRYAVVWPDNSQLWIANNASSMALHVYLASGRSGQVAGLFGNDNGEAGDDLMTPDASLVLLPPSAPFDLFYGTYVESWRVTDADPVLFEYPDGESTQSPDITNRDFPTNVRTASDLRPDQAVEGLVACSAVSADWQKACILDVGLSNDPSFVTAYANAPPVSVALDLVPPYGGPPRIMSALPQLVVPGDSIKLVGRNLATVSGRTSDVQVVITGSGAGAAATVPLTIDPDLSDASELTVTTPMNLYQVVPGAATISVRTPALVNGGGGATAPVTVVQSNALGDPSDAGTDGLFGAAYQLVSGTTVLPNFGSILSLTDPCSDPSVVNAPDGGSPCPLTTFDMPDLNVSYFNNAPGYPGLTSYFALRFRGRLIVPVSGTYQFTIVSDDGSNVYLFDAAEIDAGGFPDGGTGLGPPLINHDGLQADTAASASATLTAGTYGLVVDYFNGPGPGAGLQLFWTPPGESATAIPASQLQAWLP
jgi:hypothetical protein